MIIATNAYSMAKRRQPNNLNESMRTEITYLVSTYVCTMNTVYVHYGWACLNQSIDRREFP